jgi:hypothetical protein
MNLTSIQFWTMMDRAERVAFSAVGLAAAAYWGLSRHP